MTIIEDHPIAITIAAVPRNRPLKSQVVSGNLPWANLIMMMTTIPP
jgi:hypothetical protein